MPCWLLCFAAACGRTRDEAPLPFAGAGAFNPPADASAPGRHCLALINEQVQIVHFDEPSSPITTTVSDSQGASSVAFTNDGARLAYAVGTEQGPWQVSAASVLSGEALGVTWSLPSGGAPTLFWVGNESLFAHRVYEPSSLLRAADGSVSDIGIIRFLNRAADESSLVAMAESRLLYVGAASAAWSEPISGSWSARLAADGRGLAVFSSEELPAFDLPVPTTRVRWSPPTTPPCSPTPQAQCPDPPRYGLNDVEWGSSDTPIATEFRAVTPNSTHIALVFIAPGATEPLSAPPASFRVLGRSWGVLRSGAWFMLENPDDPTTDAWWLRSVAPNGEVTRAQGPQSFAQRALASGDESQVFVVSYARSTERTTVEVVALPVRNGSVTTPVFSTNQRVDELWSQPRGSRVLIATSDPDQAGNTTPLYYLAAGDSTARALPSGLHDVRWTPDGQGFIGITGQSVVYLAVASPDRLITLGRGSYVLPKHW